MPRTTAASLAVRALEEVGVTHTFGIPGVHNTELYDELDRSEKITPVLVTSEFNGGFMADAMSRVGSGVGCLALVPAAGFTHAASGIGEMFVVEPDQRTHAPAVLLIEEACKVGRAQSARNNYRHITRDVPGLQQM